MKDALTVIGIAGGYGSVPACVDKFWAAVLRTGPHVPVGEYHEFLILVDRRIGKCAFWCVLWHCEPQYDARARADPNEDGSMSQGTTLSSSIIY